MGKRREKAYVNMRGTTDESLRRLVSHHELASFLKAERKRSQNDDDPPGNSQKNMTPQEHCSSEPSYTRRCKEDPKGNNLGRETSEKKECGSRYGNFDEDDEDTEHGRDMHQ